MATALPAVSTQGDHPAASATGPATVLEQALVPALSSPPPGPSIVLTPALARLPVELDVSIPVRNFRVRNLLALECSHLIESDWGHGDDVPLAAGQVQLAWSEFEVIETQLAVRLTRLV